MRKITQIFVAFSEKLNFKHERMTSFMKPRKIICFHLVPKYIILRLFWENKKIQNLIFQMYFQPSIWILSRLHTWFLSNLINYTYLLYMNLLSVMLFSTWEKYFQKWFDKNDWRMKGRHVSCNLVLVPFWNFKKGGS